MWGIQWYLSCEEYIDTYHTRIITLVIMHEMYVMIIRGVHVVTAQEMYGVIMHGIGDG